MSPTISTEQEDGVVASGGGRGGLWHNVVSRRMR